jgi:hypothetical protein
MPSRTDLLIWSTQVARCLFYRGLSDFYRATDLARTGPWQRLGIHPTASRRHALRGGGIESSDGCNHGSGHGGTRVDLVARWPLGDEQFEIGRERRIVQFRGEIVVGAGDRPPVRSVRAEAFGDRRRFDACLFDGEPQVEQVASFASLEQCPDLGGGQFLDREGRHLG